MVRDFTNLICITQQLPLTCGARDVWVTVDSISPELIADGEAIRRASWHRADGPAVVYLNGDIQWWFKDQMFPNFKDWCCCANITDEERLMIKLQYGI